MTTKSEIEDAVEVSCEVLAHEVSTDEFRTAVEDAVAFVKNGGKFASFDERGQKMAQAVRESALEIQVTVVPDGMGTAGELIDALFHIAVVKGPISIAAYDVWKHLILPQLQERWGRPALMEKRKQAKREREAAAKLEREQTKAAKKLEKEQKKAAEKLEKEEGRAAKKLEQKKVQKPGGGDTDSAANESDVGNDPNADLNESAASSKESLKKVKKAVRKAKASKDANGSSAPEPKRKAKKQAAPAHESPAESAAPAKKKNAKVQK
ncbi:DUF1682 domain-containing protein [Paraburkholderia pallida]|uniref:DUF1682 domain-containing protein n=1 Tax=Paraburkholderia pallida TaxID=2547399 RepID=UPI001430277F|nr:DUF1682 domain-containing protein [Paraburkholderia pallida]